jgi:CRP-like cAMP-binding protein
MGEITCFNGTPASCSVVTTEQSCFFVLPVENLRKIAPQDSMLRGLIEQSIAHELGNKLRQSSRRMSESIKAA